MTQPRTSIQPTYDSRETGPRYYLSTFVRGRSLDWRKPIDDPFVSAEITIGWPGLLRALLRRRLVVRVQVDADRDLDANYLGLANCTRRAQFNGQILAALNDMDGDPQ